MLSMSECILETGDYILAALESGDPARKIVAEGTYERAILCGSGSSHHAAYMARPIMQSALGVPVEVLYPYEVQDYQFVRPENTLLIGISQSGTSKSTKRAMGIAAEAGCKIGALSATNDEGTIINQDADFIFTVQCGIEGDLQPKTKGTVLMSVELMLIGFEYAANHGTLTLEELDEKKARIVKMANNLTRVACQAEKWVESHGSRMARAQDIKVVGTKGVYGAVLEGSLKFLETLRAPVACFESEEFIHGPYNSINDDTVVMVMGDDPLLDTLSDILREWTNDVLRVSTTAEGYESFRIPSSGCPEFLQFECLIWMYVVCARVSSIKGIDITTTKDVTFHARLGSKELRK